jgi:adenylyltransferase/sulfurtransferase
MSSTGKSSPRYNRQVILPGIGPEGQARLRDARVLVVGLGGLGCPASLYLASAGVGTIGLADFDKVDESNLHRQILHDADTVGMLKVDSAAQRLLAVNPEVKIERIPDGVTTDNALSLFQGYDLVIDGTDNFATRYLINDAAFLARKAVVYGSIFQFEGQVSVFHPAQGSPCYRCLFPEIPPPDTVPNCSEAGVFGALCGIVGSWQASEAIKLITGVGEPLQGKLKVLDTLSGRDQLVRLNRNPDCALCGEKPGISEIKAENYAFSCVPEEESAPTLEVELREAAALLAGKTPPLLLDVREHHERRICVLDDDLHIPCGELQAKWKSIPAHLPVMVYCHHGVRSLYAVRFLREMGCNRAVSMQGGIDAWSREIDPEVPRY